MLFDLLMYGFKGLKKMTIEELNTELEALQWILAN
jgi:ribosomal protein L29